MKETTCYEYWKNENIQPSIKENYKIEEYSTITPLEINRQLGKISLVY
jgi:hypothetical protein